MLALCASATRGGFLSAPSQPAGGWAGREERATIFHMKRYWASRKACTGAISRVLDLCTWVVFVRCQTFIPQFDRVNLPCVI